MTSGKASRISRDDLFFGIARLFAERSTCPRASVGALAVQEGRVVASGYNGAPAGMPHCYDVGCQIVFESPTTKDPMSFVEHCVRSVHAEVNTIAWAARLGVSLKGSHLYLTHSPCFACSKLIVNAGIQAVHIEQSYGGEKGVSLLQDARVLVFRAPS